jgi:hypothetical protein
MVCLLGKVGRIFSGQLIYTGPRNLAETFHHGCQAVSRIYVDTHFLLATSSGGTGSVENREVTPVILVTVRIIFIYFHLDYC